MYVFDLQLFVTCLDKDSKEAIPHLFSDAGWILFFVSTMGGSWPKNIISEHANRYPYIESIKKDICQVKWQWMMFISDRWTCVWSHPKGANKKNLPTVGFLTRWLYSNVGAFIHSASQGALLKVMMASCLHQVPRSVWWWKRREMKLELS